MPPLVFLCARLAPVVGPRIIELFDLAVLPIQAAEIDRASIDAWWRTGLESRGFEAKRIELLGEMNGRSITRAATGNARISANVQAPTEKRSGGNDDGLGAESAPLERFDADNAPLRTIHE